MSIEPWVLALGIIIIICGMATNFYPKRVPYMSGELPAHSFPTPPVVFHEKFEDYLNSIQSRIGNSAIIPTEDNLDRISGQVTVHEEKPIRGYVYNEDAPEIYLPTMTAQALTDVGTHAEIIQSSEIARPSIRQNIRDEDDINHFSNPNAITYTSF